MQMTGGLRTCDVAVNVAGVPLLRDLCVREASFRPVTLSPYPNPLPPGERESASRLRGGVFLAQLSAMLTRPIHVWLGFRRQCRVWFERHFKPATADTLKTRRLGGMDGCDFARRHLSSPKVSHDRFCSFPCTYRCPLPRDLEPARQTCQWRAGACLAVLNPFGDHLSARGHRGLYPRGSGLRPQ